jgi:integrase
LSTRHAGGRPRKGSLEFRGKTWHARLTVTVDGVNVRKWFNLESDNKAVARRKLARLMAEQVATAGPSVAELAVQARRKETVADLAAAYGERRKAEGVKTWKDEDRWLRLDVLPAIGSMPVDAVKPAHVREVLEASRAKGRGKQSLIHVRGVMHRLFQTPWRDELIPENPVARVEVPKVREVKRARAILADSEFVQFVSCGQVDLELRVMAVAARAVGGMRTGDVHAWSWEEIDLVGFARCVVPRVKTGQPQELLIPDVGRVVLEAWWRHKGCPASGPVFPARRGARAGEHKKKASHAHRLRKALLVAGVARHELHSDTPTTRRADFHSFRRAFSTALADVGANVQLASRLAGHADLSAHNRYLMQSQAMRTIPEGAVPKLLSFATDVAKTKKAKASKVAEFTVGVRGFEPPTAGTQSRPSTRLRYTPG